MGSSTTGAGGFGSGFVQSMGEDRLGVGRGPAVGKHLFQTRVIGMEAKQELTDVAPRLDPMTLGVGEDRVQHGRPRACCLASQKEPILPADGLVAKRSLAHVIVDRQATIDDCRT